MTITVKTPQLVGVTSTATTLYTGTSATKIDVRELTVVNTGTIDATITVTKNNGTNTANKTFKTPVPLGAMFQLNGWGLQPSDIIQIKADTGTIDVTSTIWEYT